MCGLTFPIRLQPCRINMLSKYETCVFNFFDFDYWLLIHKIYIRSTIKYQDHSNDISITKNQN